MGLILHYGGEALLLDTDHTLEQVTALLDEARTAADSGWVTLRLHSSGQLHVAVGASTPIALETATGNTINGETIARELDAPIVPAAVPRE